MPQSQVEQLLADLWDLDRADNVGQVVGQMQLSGRTVRE